MNEIPRARSEEEERYATSTSEHEDRPRRNQKHSKHRPVPTLDTFISPRQDDVTPREFNYLVSRLVESPRPVSSVPVYYVPQTSTYVHSKSTSARHMTWPAPGSPDNVELISPRVVRDDMMLAYSQAPPHFYQNQTPVPYNYYYRFMSEPSYNFPFPNAPQVYYPAYNDIERMPSNVSLRDVAGLRTPSFEDSPQVQKKKNKPRPAPTMVSKSHENVSVDKISNNIYAMAKDQTACRILQALLEDGSHMNTRQEFFYLILGEVKEHVLELLSHEFGNYLFQKLFEVSSDDIRTDLLCAVQFGLASSSCSVYGTRAVQKIIALCYDNVTHMSLIMSSLKDSIESLSVDIHGNHVVQNCLNLMRGNEREILYTAIINSCLTISCCQYGFRIMEKCINDTRTNQCMGILDKLNDFAIQLIQDSFGNYVIQHLLRVCPTERVQPICTAIVGNITMLSQQKCASNVIEKCIRRASPEIQSQYLDEILIPSNLSLLVSDKFGNYVIQTSLEVLRRDLRKRLVDALTGLLPMLHHSDVGLKIIGKMRSA